MAVTIIRDPITGASFPAVPGRKAYLYTEDGQLSFTFEFAPSEIQYQGWELTWTQVPRVGMAPLVMYKDDGVDTITFTAQLSGKTDYFEEQHAALVALKSIASSKQRIVFMYSQEEAGLYRITKCNVASQLRHPTSNEVIRGTVDLELTRAVDPQPGVGPVSSNAANAGTTSQIAVANPQAVANTPARTYTVTGGDSLWSIAARMYGNGAKWPLLYDANRGVVKLPWLITPGMVLVIP